MAVLDTYVNANDLDGKKGKTGRAVPGQPLTLIETVEVAAGDDDGSVWRFFKGLNPNLIPVRITVMCDALTSGTDYDLGFYKTNAGAVIDKDNLMDGQTLASASKALDGMGNVDKADYGKRLWELAGHTAANKLASYDIALTGNTVGSAAGTVTIIAEFIQG